MKNWANLFFLVAAGCALGLAFVRLCWGVEFTDESYYIALAYRFFLGDKPFIDELYVQQSAALVYGPFITLYLWLTKSTDGLMLFSRCLYLAASLITAYAVISNIKKRYGPVCSIIIALALVFFMPYGIANVSYNTLGAFGLAAGLFWWLNVDGTTTPKSAFLGGFSFAISAIAYPPLALIGALIFGQVFLKKFRWKSFLCGAFTVLLICAFQIDIVGVYETLKFTLFDYQEHGGEFSSFKIPIAIKHLWLWDPMKWIALPLFGIVYYFRKNLKGILPVIFVLAPFWFEWPSITRGSVLFVGTFALGSGVIYFLLDKDDFIKRLMTRVWLPSFLAGWITVYFSTEAAVAYGVGALPAALAGSCFFVEGFLQNTSKFRQWAPLPAFVVLCILCFLCRSIYREDSWKDLSFKIASGPFSGLYTTSEKAGYLASLKAMITPYENARGRILFYHFLPAGYLLTSMKPATSSVYLCEPTKRHPDYCSERYKLYVNPKNITVNVKQRFETRILMGKLHSRDPILDMLIPQMHKKVSENEFFEVYTGDFP